MWWCTTVILTLRKLMQEDWDFQSRLSYLPELTPTPTLNKTKLLLSPQTLHKKQLEGFEDTVRKTVAGA